MDTVGQWRFVVLRHEVGPRLDRTESTHFDWMFESGDKLRTWASEPVDRFDLPFELSCEALREHRREYLDYEGPVSGQRGRVSRVAQGQFVSLEGIASRFLAQLSWQVTDEYAGEAYLGKARAGEAVVEFHRSLRESSLPLEGKEAWRLRFSPGRYETKR